MRIGPRLLLVATALCAGSCVWPGAGTSSPPAEGVSEAPTILLRARNASRIDFDRLTVEFPNQTEEFGALAAGEASEYRMINGAYRYAYAEARHGDQIYLLQPIDFVGESYLRAGTYTYDFEVPVTEESPGGPGGTIHGYMHVKVRRDSDERARPNQQRDESG